MQSKEQQVFVAIKIHFDSDKRRVKFISYLIVSLLKITTCALSEWSRAIAQPTQRASRYKRLQRFVSQFRFSGRIYARVVWSVFGQGKQVVLTLDRTEYQMRGQWIQVLMLAIAHQGVSIPLIWHTTNRRGNAGQSARKALLKAFTTWLPLSATGQRLYLTADREFIGPECRQAPASAVRLHSPDPYPVQRPGGSQENNYLDSKTKCNKPGCCQHLHFS